jgi:hypothetical protein
VVFAFLKEKELKKDMTDEEFWDRLLIIEMQTASLYSLPHGDYKSRDVKLNKAMQIVKDYNEFVADYLAKPKLRVLREKLAKEREKEEEKPKVVAADVVVHRPIKRGKNRPQNLRKVEDDNQD